MSSYAAAIELCKDNVLFLNAGQDLKSTDLKLITWKETATFHAAIIRSFTTEAAGCAPTMEMLALSSASLNPGTNHSDDSVIKEAIDAMLAELQDRVGKFAPALATMPNQRMTAFLPKHYSEAISGRKVVFDEEKTPTLFKRMNPLRSKRSSFLYEIPDRWANLNEAAKGIFTVDGKLVTRAQLKWYDAVHVREFEDHVWRPPREVAPANPVAETEEVEGSGELEGN